MLKTLDRYIIRQFLGTFLLLLVLIMAIAVVFYCGEILFGWLLFLL